MNRFLSDPKRILTWFALLLCLAVAGCSGTPDSGGTKVAGAPVADRAPNLPPIEPSTQVARLLLQAQQSAPPLAQAYRLRAADILFRHGDLYRARSILGYVAEDQLTPEQARSYMMLNTEIAVLMGDGQAALQQLDNPPPGATDLVTPEAQLRMSELRASALDQSGDHMAAALERIMNTANLLPPDQQAANHQAIWNSLMALPAEELTAQAERSPFSNIKGWMELAALNKSHQQDIDQQLEALNNWLLRHPAHPAAMALPGELRSLTAVMREQPKRVTLLLPLSGPYAAAVGIPVRDGFLAAYYLALERGRDVPDLQIINTDGVHDFAGLYRRLVREGTEFVIGPFEKPGVQQLALLGELPVPVLALNYVQGMEAYPKGLYQFGLSALDEARAAAEQAWRDGHRFALSLTPASFWGEEVAAAFREHWLSLGGTLADAQHFGGDDDFKAVTGRVLDVNASRARAARLQKLLNEEIEFIPRKREDADFLFMAALPRDARQIKPSLDYHQARDLPVYATSHMFSGRVNRRLDSDLNGVRFCDIPWILAPASSIRERVEQHWGRNAENFGRLYAMGADAYQLYRRIHQLGAFAQSRYFGQTGTLTLNSKGQIGRVPVWAVMKNGEPQLLQTTGDQLVSRLEAAH